MLPAHTSEITAPTPVITDAAPRPRRRWTRGIAIALVAIFGFLALYLGVTFVQVWMARADDGATKSDAIVVLGAAQYDGRPSPVLAARLDHALELWQDGLAPLIVVTGGKRPGDRFTEATAGANYLLDHGVPDAQILREVQGTTSWESLAAAARILRERGLDEVMLVSDPYHALRIGGIADEVGLAAHVSPTTTSPSREPRRSVTWSRRPAPSRSGGSSATAASSSSRADPARPPGFLGAARSHGPRSAKRTSGSSGYDARALRGWCNRQHSRFWSCRWGFESSPPSHSKDLCRPQVVDLGLSASATCPCSI